MSIQSVLATCRADVAAGVVVVVQDKVLDMDMHQGLALAGQKVYPVFSGMAAGSVPHKRINAGQPFRLKTFMCCTVERTRLQTELVEFLSRCAFLPHCAPRRHQVAAAN